MKGRVGLGRLMLVYCYCMLISGLLRYLTAPPGSNFCLYLSIFELLGWFASRSSRLSEPYMMTNTALEDIVSFRLVLIMMLFVLREMLTSLYDGDERG